MDSPAVPLPQDPREQVILSRLSEIRDCLLLLMQDRTTYIRSQDVIPLYDDTMTKVQELSEIRSEIEDQGENRRTLLPQLLRSLSCNSHYTYYVRMLSQ